MKETILVVEDDEMIRNLIRIYLEKMNIMSLRRKMGWKQKNYFCNSILV